MIRRLRKFILIGGTLLSVLIAAAFVASAWWWEVIAFQMPKPYGPCVFLVGGSIAVDMSNSLYDWEFMAVAGPRVLFMWNHWDRSSGFVQFPVYAVFLAVALPTFLVWRFSPKFPRGHCRRCGYNLTGLTEARCPECGAEFPKGDGACG